MSDWRRDIEVQRLREALKIAETRALAAELRSSELDTVLDKIDSLLYEAGFHSDDADYD